MSAQRKHTGLITNDTVRSEGVKASVHHDGPNMPPCCKQSEGYFGLYGSLNENFTAGLGKELELARDGEGHMTVGQHAHAADHVSSDT